jgi:micrococcal nuclease
VPGNPQERCRSPRDFGNHRGPPPSSFLVPFLATHVAVISLMRTQRCPPPFRQSGPRGGMPDGARLRHGRPAKGPVSVNIAQPRLMRGSNQGKASCGTLDARSTPGDGPPMSTTVIRAAEVAALLASAALASPAQADPCEFIPDRGPLTPEVRDVIRRGNSVTGPVVHVIDGDSICVSLPPHRPGIDWIELRLGDFNAPELNEPGGREALNRVRGFLLPGSGRGRTLTCTASHRSWDRIVATCRVAPMSGPSSGRTLGDAFRGMGVPQGVGSAAALSLAADSRGHRLRVRDGLASKSVNHTNSAKNNRIIERPDAPTAF